MMPITTRRLFLASVASALALFVLPFIGVLIGWSQMPFLNADGTPDNAPVRGGAAFVLLSPALFLIVTGFAFFLTLLLRRFGHLTPKPLLIVVFVVSIAAGLFMAHDRHFGWNDAVFTFVVFAALVFVASGFSAWVWWKIAMRPNRTVERDGPQAARPSL